MNPTQIDMVVQTSTLTSTIDKWRVPFDESTNAPVDHTVQLPTDYFTQTVVPPRWTTSQILDGIVHWTNERAIDVDLLKEFAAWQKRKLDYDGVYAAWLLEAMSEHEFIEEAKKFAVVLGERDPKHVVDVAERLARLLPFDLTTAEIAEFLKTEPRSVLSAIAHCGEPSEKLKALLPEQKLQIENE
jgi:hypothetical protein